MGLWDSIHGWGYAGDEEVGGQGDGVCGEIDALGEEDDIVIGVRSNLGWKAWTPGIRLQTLSVLAALADWRWWRERRRQRETQLEARVYLCLKRLNVEGNVKTETFFNQRFWLFTLLVPDQRFLNLSIQVPLLLWNFQFV